MKEVWTYERFAGESSGFDLTGWDVFARDDHLGKVDEATYETGRSYMVVDTGLWIFGKKRMIPAGSIDRIDPDGCAVYVALTKDEVKQAPDYDEVSGTRRHSLQRHSDYYGRTTLATAVAHPR